MQKYNKSLTIHTNTRISVDDGKVRVFNPLDAKEESDVIPVKYDPGKGVFASTSGSKLLSREEFEQLLEATNQQIRRICSELYRGDITARPKRQTKKDRDGNQFTACTYCDYRSICVFDTSIPGCRYEDV